MAGRRKALIIANDVYEHEGLKHLRTPGVDADALADILGDARVGDFDVHVVRNEPTHIIQGHIEDLCADSRADDLLLLHFSCHGLKSESGELFFAARNTLPNRLGSTAISADFVQRCMRASRSRSIVLFLDCCYGGAFSRGVTVRAAGDANVLDSFPGGKVDGGRGRAVITASSAMEYAFEGDQLADDQSRRPSVFTSALVEGLATGDADRDQDGWVSLNELYDYVFDRVREQNPHQTPSRDVRMQGELYLARRNRPVTTPAPLPSELQNVIDHPLANVRAGAVRELARLKKGGHAGLALAATMALERLADDDSRTVAAAAAALLTTDEDDGAHPVRPPTAADETSTLREQPPFVDDPEKTRTANSQTEPPESASPQSLRERLQALPRHRHAIYLVGSVVVVAVAAAAVALLLPDRGPPTTEGQLRADEFTATSPWRLVIRDNISGMDNGCDVTVTNLDNDEPLPVPTDVYGTTTFQIRDTGSYRWKANDSECLVVVRAGPGKVALPFGHDAGGDTDAFDVEGPVTVEVLDFHGNSGCDFVLHDAADGRQLDFASVQKGGSRISLDPGRQSQVYLANLYCTVRVTAG